MQNQVVLAWCEMKIAECDQRVSMAKMVGMENAAAADARDARFFRAVVSKLSQQQGSDATGSPQAGGK